MTFDEFKREDEVLMDFANEIMNEKGGDYTDGKNRFHNFEEIARELDMSREKVLWIYMKKHLEAIRSFITEGRVQSEDIRSRIADTINYLRLLNGMTREKKS